MRNERFPGCEHVRFQPAPNANTTIYQYIIKLFCPSFHVVSSTIYIHFHSSSGVCEFYQIVGPLAFLVIFSKMLIKSFQISRIEKCLLSGCCLIRLLSDVVNHSKLYTTSCENQYFIVICLYSVQLLYVKTLVVSQFTR